MILVTGANGFIGNALCNELFFRGIAFKGIVRKLNSFEEHAQLTNIFQLGDINDVKDWHTIFNNISTIIHCAFPSKLSTSKINYDNFRDDYLKGINRLIEQAVFYGVERFIFISSIKVNGQKTVHSKSCDFFKKAKTHFTYLDNPAPTDIYGTFKWETEQKLWEISKKTGIEVVVIRPPLVYGPNVKGNLRKLLKLVRIGVPLPLGAIQNKRSLIGIDNLLDILIRCVESDAVKNKTLLVSDGNDVSTPELLNYMAGALGRSSRLFPFPISLLNWTAKLINKTEEVNRLIDSLQIDNSYANKLLGWKPKLSIIEGIERMVNTK